jgi:toxin CcdB
MARFDVFRNPRRESARDTPFLQDVQSDLLDGLATRVVVPLRRGDLIDKRVTRLNPLFKIAGAPVVMDTPQLAGYPSRGLKRPVANLASNSFEMRNALDFLLAGI